MKFLNSIFQIGSNFLLTTILFFGFTFCEPTTHYSKVVENNSSSEVRLIVRDVLVDSPDTVKLGRGTQYVVLDEENMGAPYDDYKECSNDKFRLSVINELDSSAIEITSEMDWVYDESSKKKGLSNTVQCTFIIEDTLFE